MLALVLVMLLCLAAGAGVVLYVMLEARREGRGEFWTAEGEELIAGARRTTEKVKARGEQLGRTAAERTKDLASRLPERGHAGDASASSAEPAQPQAQAQPQDEQPADADGTHYRAAS